MQVHSGVNDVVLLFSSDVAASCCSDAPKGVFLGHDRTITVTRDLLSVCSDVVPCSCSAVEQS